MSEDDKAKAESLKNQANDYFKKQDYSMSITLYTQAIDVNPFVAAYYGNRSFAYLKTECFGYGLSDANKALGKFKLALKDFESVTKARPNDKDAKNKYSECNKIVKRLAFEKAIAVEDQEKKSVAETINLETMSIE